MQPITREAAALKIKSYCSYQERSHKEVKEKLYGIGLKKIDVEELLCYLIEEGYLNEERYARQFSGGKFRTKKWGRVKILQALKFKGVSSYNINLALEEIDEEDYLQVLLQLAKKKYLTLKDDQYLIRQAKTKNYLLQKGYEMHLVQNVVKQITSE